MTLLAASEHQCKIVDDFLESTYQNNGTSFEILQLHLDTALIRVASEMEDLHATSNISFGVAVEIELRFRSALRSAKNSMSEIRKNQILSSTPTLDYSDLHLSQRDGGNDRIRGDWDSSDLNEISMLQVILLKRL